MNALALELIPLGIGSALIPLPLIVTVLLLRGKTGRPAATGWVAGQAVTRLAQGLLVAVLLDQAIGKAGDEAKGPVMSALLLVLSLVFYLLAARKIAKAPDDDAPPPAWMDSLGSASPGRTFLFGCGFTALSVKLWVFTLGATGAIAAAALGFGAAAGAFALWLLLSLSLQLGLVVLALVAPARAEVVLARVGDLLERHSRALLIGAGLIFGTIFLIEGLTGLGVL
jgi:hypothetical protein